MIPSFVSKNVLFSGRDNFGRIRLADRGICKTVGSAAAAHIVASWSGLTRRGFGCVLWLGCRVASWECSLERFIVQRSFVYWLALQTWCESWFGRVGCFPVSQDITSLSCQYPSFEHLPSKFDILATHVKSNSVRRISCRVILFSRVRMIATRGLLMCAPFLGWIFKYMRWIWGQWLLWS